MPCLESSSHLWDVLLGLIENNNFGRRRDESENMANGVDQNLVAPISWNCYRYRNGGRHLIARRAPLQRHTVSELTTQNSFLISRATQRRASPSTESMMPPKINISNLLKPQKGSRHGPHRDIE